MGDVVEGGQLVFQAVAGPHMILAGSGEAVDGPGGCPHQIGPGFVIVGMLQGYGGVFQYGLHESFHDRIQHEHAFARVEVGFHNVGHDVSRAAGRLIPADRNRQLRIQEGDFGAQCRRGTAKFLAGFHIADDNSRIHFGAGGGHGGDGQDGQGFCQRKMLRDEIPGIEIHTGSGGNEFARIHTGPAACGQHHITALFFAESRALTHGLDPGIGFDAGQFHPIQLAGFELGNQPVIQAGAFDGTAAVDQQYLVAEPG